MSKISCGMSVLRQTLPKTINPKGIGYIQPNGIINFQTAEAAETYAKNRVLAALKSLNPFERGVELKGTRILGEADGDAFLISNEAASKILHEQGSTFVHGHPQHNELGALPLSLTDFVSMITQKYSKIIAYNTSGEYCTLKRKPKGFFMRLLPKNLLDEIEQIGMRGDCLYATELYSKRMSPLYPPELQDKMDYIFQYGYKKMGYFFNKKKAKIGEEIVKNMSTEELILLAETEKNAICSQKGTEIIHNFWQKFAKHTGDFEYSTNFSNLVK
ncbi:hypothetical protein IKQ21_01365 [bacterium]|nr:hypothetical protein [bacterium]